MGNSVLQSGTSIGAFLTPQLLGILLTEKEGSWRLGFQVVGAIGVVWIVAWFMVVRSTDFQKRSTGTHPRTDEPSANAPTSFGATFEVCLREMLTARMLAVVIVLTLINACWQTLRAWLPKVMQQEYQCWMFSFGWFSGLAGSSRNVDQKIAKPDLPGLCFTDGIADAGSMVDARSMVAGGLPNRRRRHVGTVSDVLLLFSGCFARSPREGYRDYERPWLDIVLTNAKHVRKLERSDAFVCDWLSDRGSVAFGRLGLPCLAVANGSGRAKVGSFPIRSNHCPFVFIPNQTSRILSLPFGASSCSLADVTFLHPLPLPCPRPLFSRTHLGARKDLGNGLPF